jgi:nicotinamidase-related amidase
MQAAMFLGAGRWWLFPTLYQDIVVEGKHGLCGFASTNLDFILRSRGITNVVLGGFLTNCCVE